jgi:glycosyltransferase involved in cell wall biosynthesis
MRVLYVWQAKYPWDIRVQKVTETLADAGHEVTVLARGSDGLEPPQEELAHGVKVIRLPPRFSAPISGSPAWSWALDKTIRSMNADVLIVRDLPLIVNAVRAARKHRLPIVMDMAEHYPGAMRSWKKYHDNPVAKWLVHDLKIPDRLERWGTRRVAMIWVVCSEQQERLHREYGVPAENTIEVGNTPPLRSFPNVRRGASIPPRVIGHHGHMTPERGLGLLIEAFHSVSSQFPDVTMELAGTGETTSQVQDQIRMRGLGSRVRMVGRYRHSDLEELYGRVDLAVLPYPPGELVNHTLSNKFFDYMACAKPLLASAAPPMKRMIDETGAGAYFEPWSVSALTARLRELLDNAPLGAMGGRGRRAFETRYHWEIDAERMLASIRRVERPAQ